MVSKVVGFWKKLFSKCVSLKDYEVLSKSHDEALSDLEDKLKITSALKSDKNKLEDDIIKLKEKLDDNSFRLTEKENKVNELMEVIETQKQQVKELTETVDQLTKSLTLEKEKHDLTLKMLKECQSSILLDDKQCEQVETSVVCEPVETPVVTDNVEQVTSDNKITTFINSLTDLEIKSLHNAIIEGHKNDKRLSTTMQNWIEKSSDLKVQTTNMFRSALYRRRGKSTLKEWYKKYDSF